MRQREQWGWVALNGSRRSFRTPSGNPENPSGDSEGSECGDIGLAQGRESDSVIDHSAEQAAVSPKSLRSLP